MLWTITEQVIKGEPGEVDVLACELQEVGPCGNQVCGQRHRLAHVVHVPLEVRRAGPCLDTSASLVVFVVLKGSEAASGIVDAVGLVEERVDSDSCGVVRPQPGAMYCDSRFRELKRAKRATKPGPRRAPRGARPKAAARPVIAGWHTPVNLAGGTGGARPGASRAAGGAHLAHLRFEPGKASEREV